MDVEAYRLVNVGIDEVRLAKARAKQVRSWLKAHPGDTEGAEKWADLFCGMYAHHFRTYIRA